MNRSHLTAWVLTGSLLSAWLCASPIVVSGRGGLPLTPEQQLDDDADWQDRRRLVVTQTNDGRGVRSQESGAKGQQLTGETDTPYPTPYTPLIEATGWQVTPAGAIALVATSPSPTVQNPLNQPIACPGR